MIRTCVLRKHPSEAKPCVPHLLVGNGGLRRKKEMRFAAILYVFFVVLELTKMASSGKRLSLARRRNAFSVVRNVFSHIYVFQITQQKQNIKAQNLALVIC